MQVPLQVVFMVEKKNDKKQEQQYKSLNEKWARPVGNKITSLIWLITEMPLCILLLMITCIFSFLLNLLGWHWLTKSHRIQVHSSTTHHLYIVLRVYHPSQASVHHHLSPIDPPPNSSTSLPPAVTTLLSFSRIFSLCVFWLNSNPPHNLPHSHWQLSASSLSINLSLFFVLVHFFSFDPTYEWNHMVLSFFWRILLSIIFSRSIHVVTNGSISPYLMAE